MQVKSSAIAGRTAFACLLLALSSTAKAQYDYSIINLGQVGIGGINSQGQIAVTLPAVINGNITGHAGYYQNGAFYDTQPGSTQQSHGTAISDSGLLAASPSLYGKSGDPFIYNINTGDTRLLPMYDHDSTGHYVPSIIEGINAAGDAAVVQGGTSTIYHYSTGQVEPIINIPHFFSGSDYFEGHAISNTGEIAGQVDGGYAASYQNGTFQIIPTDGNAKANGLNVNGDIVGEAYVGQYTQHAFLYHNGLVKDLGTLDPNTSSGADGINSSGVVVGGSGDYPFVYRNGQMQNLFSLVDPASGFKTGTATAINNNGWIVGFGNHGGYVAIPRAAATPAPGSLLTLSVGVGVMLLVLRRRSV